MAVFRDDMLRIEYLPAHEYYVPENGYIASEDDDDDETPVKVVTFKAAGRVIADRLDIMGIDESTTFAYLNDQFADRSSVFYDFNLLEGLPDDDKARISEVRELRASLTGAGWVQRLANSVEDPPGTRAFDNPGSRTWLLDELDQWDERFVMRAALLAFPDAEVVLDVTELEENGWMNESEPVSLASGSIGEIRTAAAIHAPVVVLTEGRTDAEFLSSALTITQPHLTDLIRFLDYERRPEGGVSALIRTVRAFAAAGIVNRVVAVFDNDTAAADGLRNVDPSNFPPHIKILRYPTLDLAKAYPTLGPPTTESPNASVALANVNELAGSIELYLGRDVLAQSDGSFRPVQWTAFIPGMSRYQGEVVEKNVIHEAFRAKCTQALKEPESVKHQDWEGLRLILDEIRAAAQSAVGGLGTAPLR